MYSGETRDTVRAKDCRDAAVCARAELPLTHRRRQDLTKPPSLTAHPSNTTSGTSAIFVVVNGQGSGTEPNRQPPSSYLGVVMTVPPFGHCASHRHGIDVRSKEGTRIHHHQSSPTLTQTHTEAHKQAQFYNPHCTANIATPGDVLCSRWQCSWHTSARTMPGRVVVPHGTVK